MGLFNIFRKRNHETAAGSDNPAGITGHFVNGNDPVRDISLNGTRGLDAIYAFLQFDYESRGYNDALTSPEESYKADNIRLFNHDLFILIDKSTTYYEGLLKEVEFHISSRSRAGLIDVVEELKTRKEMLIDHLEKVRILKQEALTGAGAIQRIGLSYQRGFMRGLSAISQSKVFNRNL
jgi:hypothetical protein